MALNNYYGWFLSSNLHLFAPSFSFLHTAHNRREHKHDIYQSMGVRTRVATRHTEEPLNKGSPLFIGSLLFRRRGCQVSFSYLPHRSILLVMHHQPCTCCMLCNAFTSYRPGSVPAMLYTSNETELYRASRGLVMCSRSSISSRIMLAGIATRCHAWQHAYV